MAINLDISENTERIPLSIQSNASPRAISSENGSPYYVGARAYVTQTSNGAVVTVIDKDGTTTATILNGTNGVDGNGIVDVSKTSTSGNVDTYTITFDDGTTETFDVTNGIDGTDGQDGEDGVGIASVVLNADYTLTILMTDGTSVTTASIRGERGEQGIQGIQGERGEQGVQGVQGERGLQGEQGVQGVKGDTGATGATGNGIANIAKTSTSGLIDTYTITYTNGATDTFQVKNGENGSGSVADVWVDGASVLDGDTAKIDLSGKADASDIPTKVSDLTNDSGFITGYTETDPVFVASAAHGITSSNISTWNGKYTKPTGGIPKTDLATAVQTSLEKADTALQSFTETDPIFAASAAHGILSSDIDNWDAKQDELVSGVSIRTINGTSILGSGDISVAAGGTPIPTASTVAEFDASAHMNSTDMTSQEVSTFVNSLVTQGVNLIDLVYPIGSYYETSDSTFNPNATWGGTWVLEAEGLVHIGAGANYTIGDTGGETEVTLTVDEMPSHSHAINYTGIGVAAGSYAAGLTAQTNGLYTANKGGGQAHNNMQPYIVVNRWHRTA